MSKIIAMVGISGSGKSTKARELFLQYGYENSVIIGRDKAREMLFGFRENNVADYYKSPDLGKMENEVTKYVDNLIMYSLLSGKIVIVDNTNLRLSFINKYRQFGVPVEFIVVDTPLLECLSRDRQRERQVGKEVITKQFQDLQNLKKQFDFKPWFPTTFKAPAYDKNKENCVIFDIDGTLADHKGIRGPFDWDKVLEDKLKKNIAALYMFCNKHKFEHNTPKVIVCSGRDAICRSKTVAWLAYYGLTFDELFMRAENDNRADYEIKQEFWEEISDKYNVLFMVDDRDQVVHHARRLGFTVLQVDYGDF
jgi:predicted kinase